MGLVIKKTIAILAIFLVVPLVIIAINWHWQPTSLNNTSKYLFLVTETASFPWAIITSAILFLVFYLLLPNKTKIILLWLLLVSTILSGQIIKSILKSHTTESRPYVLWMAGEFNITDQQFYSLTDSEKKELIHQLLNNSTKIPSWLSKHWQHETGYSFPSGHTLFAITWAFLALMLLKFKQHYIIITSAIIWSILIEISRLLLGMHRPIDLITSILIAWIISLICYFYAKKWHIVDK